MATSKEYAYYLKGNKLAIVQKDHTMEGGLNYVYDPDVGGLGLGDGNGLWKSPKESITDGLEIQYVHIPSYSITESRNKGFLIDSSVYKKNNSLYFPCYGMSENNNFTLFFPAAPIGVGNTTDYGGRRNVSYITTSAYKHQDDSQYIVVNNCEEYNGLHKIKSVDLSDQSGEYIDHGYIETYTKWNGEQLAYGEDETTSNPVIVGAAQTITSTTGSYTDTFNRNFSVGDYIFIPTGRQSATYEENRGLFKITALSDDGTQITVSKSYYQVTQEDDTAGDVGDIVESSTSMVDETYSGNRDLRIHKVLLCPNGFVDVAGIKVMQDESFELDLTHYQATSISYYVKAKYAEDAGNIEMKEYFMREFRRMVEKHESSKIIGPRILQGYSHFR